MAEPERTKIAFYNDSPVFGGHEVMTLRGIRALAEDGRFDISFVHCSCNERLAEGLSQISGLHAVPTEFCTRKLDAFRNRLSPGRLRKLAAIFAGIKPQLLVVAQGEIESGCLGFHAAKRIGLRCASYIPIPHRLSEMGAKLAGLRDALNAPLFSMPDAFITISESMKRRLRDRGARQPIHVVFNGIDVDRFSPGDMAAEREALGLPGGARIAGMAGRFEFKQKAPQVLLEAIGKTRDWHAAFVGEGPDEARLRLLPAEFGIAEQRVHFLPWSSTPERFYRAIDLLSLPSRFEGFPLVMLEAVCCGTPVYASDADGMSEFLPKAWRFRRSDASALGILLEDFLPQNCEAEVARLDALVRERMTNATFARSFVDTVQELSTI